MNKKTIQKIKQKLEELPPLHQKGSIDKRIDFISWLEEIIKHER